jgi:hypothetical protein
MTTSRPVTRKFAACLGVATATALLLGGCQTDGAAAPSSERRSTSAPSTTEPRSSPQTTPTLTPIDTSSWLPFVSEHYGFSITYPPDWEANQGRGDWTFPEDTAWPDGVEVSDWFFLDDPESGFVAASVWSVELEPGTSADEWFGNYCAVEATPCDSDEPSVAASLDGHAGRLVRASDPLAYFGIGDRLYMLAVWQPEDHPSVERYGGGHRLLEAFLSTMQLLPGEELASPPDITDVVDRWLDTSTWTTHASERYQFTIGHPATWTVIESLHDWNQETDSINWDSGGMEVFVPPHDTLSMYLAAWSVDVDPATTLAEWAQAFCDQYVGSCTVVEETSEQAFASDGDREGILIAWDDGMAAFFPDWHDKAEAGSIWEQPAPADGRIYIVESGRPDSGPYHSRELIEALSTSLCIGCEA